MVAMLRAEQGAMQGSVQSPCLPRAASSSSSSAVAPSQRQSDQVVSAAAPPAQQERKAAEKGETQQKNVPIMVTPYRHNWLISGSHRDGREGAWLESLKGDITKS